MFALTSVSLLVFSIAAAALSIVLVVALSLRPVPQGTRQKVLHTLPFVAAVAVAQAFAIFSTALWVNNTYAFYTSWDDLAGNVTAVATINVTGVVPPVQGSARVFHLGNKDGARDNQVIVWLPPQYDRPAYAHYRFPVVMFMPGQPGAPLETFIRFHFADIANREITLGHVAPFVAVFPSMTIQPPHDTQCTDMPGGPHALRWLAHTVPNFISKHLRVSPQGTNWSAMGWSTGGYCAAKLVLTYRKLFGSAVGFGAYYAPLAGGATQHLFSSNPVVRRENSPLWLYQKYGLGNDRLLVIAGRQDKWSWSDSEGILSASNGDPAVARLIFPQGGHNYHDYRIYLPAALQWAASGWSLSLTGIARDVDCVVPSSLQRC